MNLLHNEKTYYFDTEKNNDLDIKTPGDIFAISVVSLYTTTALVISSWSAVLWFTGNTHNSSPIGFIFKKIIWPLIT